MRWWVFIVMLVLPTLAEAEVQLLGLAGWPVYQQQTNVTSAGAQQLGAARQSFYPQVNPVYGGGATWWITDSIGVRADLIFSQPNIPPETGAIRGQKGWHQRLTVGTLNVLGRWNLTDRLSPYGGLGLARASSAQCDHIGCTPHTDNWGAVATVGLHYRVWDRLGAFVEARHVSTSFRHANESEGAFASEMNVTTVHIGLSWRLW